MKIRLNYTWIAMTALITAIVTAQFAESYSFLQRVIFGLIVSLLFLLMLTVRELILSIAVRHKEMPVQKIILFPFGGVYPENRDRILSAPQPLMYAARYLSNFVIAAIFYGLYATFITADNFTLAGIAQWLTYIYFMLFLVHFIPAFPLDGGQILRILLWRTSGDYYKATHTASLIGQAIGIFLLFVSVLVFIIIRQWSISLLIALSGWIIQTAAGNVRRYINTQRTLQNVRAEDIMYRDYPAMPGQLSLRELIRQHILSKGWNYLLVIDEGKFQGILTLKQIKAVPAQLRSNVSINRVMIPAARVITAGTQQNADTLYETMLQQNTDYVPILEEGNIIGVVTRYALMNIVSVRSRFGL